MGQSLQVATDEGLSQASGVSAASRAQESGRERRARTGLPACPGDSGQEKVTFLRVCPLFCCCRPGRQLGPGGAGHQFTVGTWLWCKLNSLALRRRLAMLLAILTPEVAGLEPPGL